MKRIGIYGGSFDPPHIGHVEAAKYAVTALALDRLLVIPSFQSPHKGHMRGSSEERLNMVRCCFGGVDRVEVCDLEVVRGGISYTFETVQQLRNCYPDAELVLCMGSDMFLSFQSWRQWQIIIGNASLGVFYRGHKDEALRIEKQKRELETAGAVVYLVKNPVTAISSSDLRRLILFGCADAFLPEGVADYIRENGLYGCGADYRQLPIDRLEQVVVGLLKPERVAHVLGCRDTAARLARRWGADEQDAARAGLLHDITKALDGPLQLTLCRAYDTMLGSFSQKNPKTLHALTGSLVAERIFGENPAVVSAICSHTTGKANMNVLEKIIYVADYMEPNRDFSGVEQLRYYAETDLDMALKTGLQMTLAMLTEQGREISPGSRQALAWLDERMKQNVDSERSSL